MLDQGFWLFFIFQLLALGMLSERMNLIGLRRTAILAGIGGSLVAALFFLLLNYGGIGTDARGAFKWLALGAMMCSLVATAGALALPPQLSRRKA